MADLGYHVIGASVDTKDYENDNPDTNWVIGHSAEDDGRMPEEWGTHVGREEAKDVHEGFFKKTKDYENDNPDTNWVSFEKFSREVDAGGTIVLAHEPYADANHVPTQSSHQHQPPSRTFQN
jgi:hypothetical protein